MQFRFINQTKIAIIEYFYGIVALNHERENYFRYLKSLTVNVCYRNRVRWQMATSICSPWSRGVWLIVEFRMNSLIWNRGLMMLVFYAFLDVSLYVQGVYVIPAYSFLRQKKVHPKSTHPSIICFHCSPRSIYSFGKILHLHHKSTGHVHLL